MIRLIVSAAAVVALTSGFARAADLPTTTKSIAVAYADLDLTREPGARVLLRRIGSAAKAACGPAPDIRELAQRAHYAACVDKAMSNAVAAVGAPLVAELYGKNGPSSAALLADR